MFFELVRTLRFYQALGAEFLGTLILTMIISGLGVKLDPNSVNPNIAGAFGAGLTVAFVVWVTNSVSGGNVNPAISIALVVTHELHILKGIVISGIVKSNFFRKRSIFKKDIFE